MKRLILTSIIGCMLMSNVQASQLITRENTLLAANGLAIGAAPLVARGAVVAIDSWLFKHRNIDSNLPELYPSLISYFSPNVTYPDLWYRRAGAELIVNTVPNDGKIPTYSYMRRTYIWNKIAALLSAGLFVGGIKYYFSNFKTQPNTAMLSAGVSLSALGSLVLLVPYIKCPFKS
jgi:hypothetical protein